MVEFGRGGGGFFQKTRCSQDKTTRSYDVGYVGGVLKSS